MPIRFPLGRLLVVVCVLMGAPVPAGAQAAPADAAERVIRAHFVPDGLVVDGRLDESVYESTIPSATEFVQQEPQEGQPATEKTDVWVLFDDRNFYVGARLWDSHPERIVANEMRRDAAMDIYQNENFSVTLDTFNDHRSGFYFMTNPLGAMRDVQFVSENQVNSEFNPIWNPKAARFDGGWTVEIEIPFKSLRYPGQGEQVWGLQLRRVVRWKNESTYLTSVPASVGASGVYRMQDAARLEGVRTPAVGRNLEIKPYVTSRTTTDRVARPADPNTLDGDAGIDVKLGLTQSVTADFTYNTDFAQVEDDLRQVNLTRFGLFFPEKREFFLEGQGIFDFGGQTNGLFGGGGNTPTMFFSRRIGLSNGVPVPIQGGARLTGKIGKYTVGLINIQTGESDLAGASATNFGVVRLRRDIFRNSYVGFLATERNPSQARDNSFYGVDANLSFGLTTVALYYAQTRTPELVGGDRSYTATYDYNADRYGVSLDHVTVQPNFNPELGFLRRRDFRTSGASFRFSPRPRTRFKAVRKFTYRGSGNYTTDNSGTLESRGARGEFRMELENGDTLSTSVENDYELLAEPFGIAQGVTIPTGGYTFSNVGGSYQLGVQHLLRGTVRANAGTFYGGTRRTAGFSGRLDAFGRIILEPSISANWIALPFGDFTTALLAARTTYTMSPRTNLGTLVQYSSSSHTVSVNARFRWEYTPGSDFFVVYTEGRSTIIPDRLAALQNRAFVVKLTRLFRY